MFLRRIQTRPRNWGGPCSAFRLFESSRVGSTVNDEAVFGNVRNVDLGPCKSGIIYNAVVMDHLTGVESMFTRFVDCLKLGVIPIIRVQDPESVKGFVKKLTTHWFRITYYPWVLRYKTVEQSGNQLYRTIYETVIVRSALRSYVKYSGMTVGVEYGIGGTIPGERSINRVVRLFTRTVSIVSFGRYSSRHSDLLYLFRLPS
jgi:hypothetical protein